MTPVLEILLRCDGVAETREFARFPVRVGREYDCDLRLEHGFVSRRHARIERVGDQLFLQDEGSRNGIVCDGRRLAPHERVPLVSGSQLRIKRLLARVRIVQATELAPDGPAPEKATSLYADHAIDPATVDRMAAAARAPLQMTAAPPVSGLHPALGELHDVALAAFPRSSLAIIGCAAARLNPPSRRTRNPRF